MNSRQAALLAALAMAALFSVQLLWTHGQLESLLGRRGLRTRKAAASAAGGGGDAGHRQAMEGGDLQAALGTASLSADETVDFEEDVEEDDEGRWGPVTPLADIDAAASLASPALIVFAFNRSDYLNQTLHSLMGLEGLKQYTVYVSQDGDAEGVAATVRGLAPALTAAAAGFDFWQKMPRVPELGPDQPGHAWLAQHYRWGLDRLFLERGHSHALIVEDDMLFSPDFLSYFSAAAPLLAADPSLWCVSSWNDNGFVAEHEWDVKRLFRNSYFPGLGWMMRRELWLELGPKWPKDHWDHWMRDEEVSKGRECVCPEVNRNRNIGEVGANMNKQAFKRFLVSMAWNENVTAPDYGDLSYLLRPAYTAALRDQLAEAPTWEFSFRKDAPQPEPGKTYLAPYVIEGYGRIYIRMKLWPYPRGHHRHVAAIPWRGARFLVADRRFCPLLPRAQRLPPSAGMQPVAAAQWQDCNAACAEVGLACSARDFVWLNTCAALRRHFPCEHGCTIELGPDVPAYVADPTQTLHKYCLLTQKTSRCAAKHKATARLCPCVPPKDGARRLQGHAETRPLAEVSALVAAAEGGGSSSSSSSGSRRALAAAAADGTAAAG